MDSGKLQRGVILLATLNEKESIRHVLGEVEQSVRALGQCGYGISVLIVDDSNDSEFETLVQSIFDSLGIDGRVINGPSQGLGAAILFGMSICLETQDVKFVVNLDADGQHNPGQIPELVRVHMSESNAITIGSRWVNGGSAPGLSIMRKILSRGAALMLHLFGVPWRITDPTSGFKVYNRESLELCTNTLGDYYGYGFQGASVAFAESLGWKISETPVRFRQRFAGESKMNFHRIIESVVQLRSIKVRSAQLRRVV